MKNRPFAALFLFPIYIFQVEADNIMLKERKLNIAPAIKKQVWKRVQISIIPPVLGEGVHY